MSQSTRAEPPSAVVGGRALWLGLGHEAGSVSGQAGLDHIIRHIWADLDSTPGFAWVVLRQLLAGIDEPELVCLTLQASSPAGS